MRHIEGPCAATISISDKHSGHLEDKTFECSAILPVQFFSSRRAKPEMEPERRLAFAVLADAVHCFQVNVGAQSRPKIREFTEAESWLFDQSDRGPFSFDSICYLLDLHPAGLRNALRRWQVMKIAGVSSRPLMRRSPVKGRAVVIRHRVTPRRRRAGQSA
jgi:hypothetical protein